MPFDSDVYLSGVVAVRRGGWLFAVVVGLVFGSVLSGAVAKSGARRTGGVRALPAVPSAKRVASAAAAMPTSVALCVSSTAGVPVTSAGSGSCALGTRVALPASAADQQTLISILPYVRFNAAGVGGKPTITITGGNMQITNGAGSTASVNGTGNLVLGYDESPGTQTGSHNVLIGRNAITGGCGNVATSTQASPANNSTCDNASGSQLEAITGGVYNLAYGTFSSVTGGGRNIAAGYQAAVSGGGVNTAGGSQSSVSGGLSNVASGNQASISGGQNNFAADPFASISGDVFSASADFSQASPPLGPSLATVVSKTVPAGSYDITAKLIGSNFGNDAQQDILCQLFDPAFLDSTGAELAPSGDPGFDQTMILQATATLSQSSTVDVRCGFLGGGTSTSTTVDNVVLTLTRVGGIN